MSDNETTMQTRGPVEMHYGYNVTAYPAFFIHGFSGEQKSDPLLLLSTQHLLEAAYNSYDKLGANAIPAAEQDVLGKALDALRELEQLFRRPDEGVNEAYERVGEWFHRETGYLRPGKDCRMDSSEVRQAAWDEWFANKLHATRSVLAIADGAREGAGR